MKRLFLFLLAALFGLGCIGCAPAQNSDVCAALSKIMQELGMLVRYSSVDDYGCIFAIMEEYMP